MRMPSTASITQEVSSTVIPKASAIRRARQARTQRSSYSAPPSVAAGGVVLSVPASLFLALVALCWEIRAHDQKRSGATN